MRRFKLGYLSNFINLLSYRARVASGDQDREARRAVEVIREQITVKEKGKNPLAQNRKAKKKEKLYLRKLCRLKKVYRLLYIFTQTVRQPSDQAIALYLSEAEETWKNPSVWTEAILGAVAAVQPQGKLTTRWGAVKLLLY